MKNRMKLFVPSSIVFLTLAFVTVSFGQYTFDGKSIELVAPDAGGRCVMGFGGNPYVKRVAGSSGSVALTDCSNNFVGNISSSVSVEVIRNSTTGLWCFKTSDPKVIVSYSVGSTPYSWTWLANSDSTGFYNVRDFGALGNGYTAGGGINTSADDTVAIQNAIYYAGAKMGGTVYFPEGYYRVSSTLVLPSGIILKGTTGMSSVASQSYYAGANQKSNSTIALVGANKSLFRIGECISSVKFENLSLKGEGTVGTSGADPNNTTGVEAVGYYTTSSSSQGVKFDNVAVSRFDIGLNFHAVDSNKLWQIDYVDIDHCIFTYNKTAGILIDSFDSDWNVSSSVFYLGVYTDTQTQAKTRGDGLIIDRATTLHMSNSFGGGDNYSDNNRGGTFIKALFVGGLTVVNSSAERLSETISYGKDRMTGQVWGTYSNVLTLINSGFGDPMNIWGRVNFVSTGNGYGGKNVNMGTGVRVYSTGDRFCMDLNGNYDPAAPCGRDQNGVPYQLDQAGFQGTGTIVFQSGQPTETNSSGQQLAALPAKIKGDLDIKGNEREQYTGAAANSRPILSLTVENDGILPLKPLLRMGHNPFVYDVVRDSRGWLTFSGTQDFPYRGYFFSGAPLQIGAFSLSTINGSSFALSQPGTLVYCLDCQVNTTPCTGGGSGALAVLNSSTQWACK